MVIVTKSTYPPQSAMEIGKRFLNAKPAPDYLTRSGPFSLTNEREGVVSMSIYEVENSKLADGMLALSDFYTAFFDVPGFQFKIRAYWSAEESLKMMGLA